MLYRSGGLPVINNCLGKACAVDFVCQIGLHALSEFCIVIIRHVIEGRGQHIGIGESFDGLSERIGNLELDVGECRNQRTGVDQEILSGFYLEPPPTRV